MSFNPQSIQATNSASSGSALEGTHDDVPQKLDLPAGKPKNICSETDLARRICCDDHHAFAAFYRMTFSRVIDFLLPLTRDVALAEDLMQDAYLSFWSSRKSLADVNYPGYYLIKIAGRVFFKYKRKRRPQIPISWLDDQELLNLGKEADLERDIVARDFYVQVFKVVEALPKQQRRVFGMIVFEALSYKKVAAVMEISESAVSNNLLIAREKVQHAVLKMGVQKLVYNDSRAR